LNKVNALSLPTVSLEQSRLWTIEFQSFLLGSHVDFGDLSLFLCHFAAEGYCRLHDVEKSQD
jgi:hypothetical protein